MIDYFKLNHDNELEICRDTIALYPEFQAVLLDDKELEANEPATSKFVAFKELNYIYQVIDYRSDGNQEGLDAKGLHKKAMEISRLPADWKPSDNVKAAAKVYKDIQDRSIALKSIRVLRSSVNASTMVAEEYTNFNKELLRQLKESQLDEDEYKKGLSEFLARQKDLDGIIANSNRNLQELDTSEELFKKEQQAVRIAKGQSKITKSMDPE